MEESKINIVSERLMSAVDDELTGLIGIEWPEMILDGIPVEGGRETVEVRLIKVERKKDRPSAGMKYTIDLELELILDE